MPQFTYPPIHSISGHYLPNIRFYSGFKEYKENPAITLPPASSQYQETLYCVCDAGWFTSKAGQYFDYLSWLPLH